MANTYGDISPRTAAYAAAGLLERALPEMVAARFGQTRPVPKNKSQTIKFRRYNGFPVSVTPLTEGVTPTADNISATDVTAVLSQYGRRTGLTDVIADTHEDPVLQEYTTIMGELGGQTQETILWNVIKAGTNVMFANGAARNAVNTGITADTLRRALRQLKRNNTKQITNMLRASTSVATQPIPRSFVAFCHPDLEKDLQGLPGFIRPQNYATAGVLAPSEIGTFEQIRFLTSTIYTPFIQAGAAVAAAGTMLSNSVANAANGLADVYPIVIVGMDAYASVPLAGKDSITPIVLNPNNPSDSDPLGQRGHVGFKFYTTAVILNDAWMVRVETGVAA